MIGHHQHRVARRLHPARHDVGEAIDRALELGRDVEDRNQQGGVGARHMRRAARPVAALPQAAMRGSRTTTRRTRDCEPAAPVGYRSLSERPPRLPVAPAVAPAIAVLPEAAAVPIALVRVVIADHPPRARAGSAAIVTSAALAVSAAVSSLFMANLSY